MSGRNACLPFWIGQEVRYDGLPGMRLQVLALEIGIGDDWTASVTDLDGGGFWRVPADSLSAAMTDDQWSMARWMGYGDNVKAMNFDHDRLHEALAQLIGQPSRSLAIAAGRSINPQDHTLANLEEAAVLHLQRLLATAGWLEPFFTEVERRS